MAELLCVPLCVLGGGRGWYGMASISARNWSDKRVLLCARVRAHPDSTVCFFPLPQQQQQPHAVCTSRSIAAARACRECEFECVFSAYACGFNNKSHIRRASVRESSC